MAGEAQIVVAAKVDEALAHDDDFRAIAFDRERLDGIPPPPQVLAVDFGKGGLKR
jgi:hypothetical protein